MNIRRYCWAAWYGAIDGLQRERTHIKLETQLQQVSGWMPPIRPARTAEEVRAFNEWTPERNNPWNLPETQRRSGR